MTPLRLGVVGTGYFSQFHYEAWSRIPEVELVGLVYNSNSSRANEVADKYGVPRVYDNIDKLLDSTSLDLVDICSPVDTHLSLIRATTARRIPTITQKPVATNLAESRLAAAAAADSQTLVVVHDNWRFKPWFREADRIIRSGILGEIYNVTFRLRPGDGQGPSAYRDRQSYFRDMPRFLIHETVIHLLDVFRFLLGEVDSVNAQLRRLNPTIAGEDSCHVILSFASGAAGLVDGNRLVDFEAEDLRLTLGELLIEGSSGQLRLDGSGSLHIRGNGSADLIHPYVWQNRNYGGDCVYLLQRHVTDHLVNGFPIENRIEDYLKNVQIEEAIYQSDEYGERISVDDFSESKMRRTSPRVNDTHR